MDSATPWSRLPGHISNPLHTGSGNSRARADNVYFPYGTTSAKAITGIERRPRYFPLSSAINGPHAYAFTPPHRAKIKGAHEQRNAVERPRQSLRELSRILTLRQARGGEWPEIDAVTAQRAAASGMMKYAKSVTAIADHAPELALPKLTRALQSASIDAQECYRPEIFHCGTPGHLMNSWGKSPQPMRVGRT
ncbi:MAG: hypothetical protein JO362_10320 [Streptomycetaceae bacterium]|nr:hypothetical protein [Streptomycetaceae bacterium]